MHKGKGKVHSVTRQAKDRGEVEARLHPFVTSALEGVDGQGHTPGQSPGTHCAEGMMCPKTSVDGYEGEISLPLPGFELQIVHPAITSCAICAPHAVSKRQTPNQTIICKVWCVFMYIRIYR